MGLLGKLFGGRTMERRNQSNETAAEIREIATIKFKVPTSYYHYLIVNRIDDIKEAALTLRDTDPHHQNDSWPRLMACVIYIGFRQECDQSRLGNPIAQNLLDDLNISAKNIAWELERDVYTVIG